MVFGAEVTPSKKKNSEPPEMRSGCRIWSVLSPQIAGLNECQFRGLKNRLTGIVSVAAVWVALPIEQGENRCYACVLFIAAGVRLGSEVTDGATADPSCRQPWPAAK